MKDNAVTLLPGDYYMEGDTSDGITNVMPLQLQGSGLYPGDYDFLINRLIGNGSYIHSEPNIVIRVSLNRKETWENILKLIPKGSLIKNRRRVR